MAPARQLCDATLYAGPPDDINAPGSWAGLGWADEARRIDVYIVAMSVLSLAVLYPAGNLKAVDAYFFGASASTESGLNT